MHEMAITQSVVSAIAERLPDRRIVLVRLTIGRLSGVVADSVRFCFDLVTEGTALEGAALEIDEPQGRTHCRDCGRTADVPDLVALCECGSSNVQIVSGTELLIKDVRVAS